MFLLNFMAHLVSLVYLLDGFAGWFHKKVGGFLHAENLLE